MSGNDLRIFISGQALKQARRLVCRKGLIALTALVLVVLPMSWAYSRSGAAASDEFVGWAVPTDSSVPVWSELPGMSMEPLPEPIRPANPEASVESFTVYANPAPSAASPVAIDDRQLVAEIQRRLARMTAGVAPAAMELPGALSRPAPTMSLPRVSNVSPGLDVNAPLQLFQPAGWSVPADAPRKVPPVPSEPLVTEDRPAPSPSFSPAAEAAFVRHFAEAKALQQAGQYARAADAFTLALAYRPYDANACLGKSLALFAAGQYAGSSAALARAMELDSQTALKKVDLVKIAGGPDELIARFNDLIQKTETRPAPEQQFLLAYIYYQMGQLEQAKTAIEVARTGSTSPASAEILRTAINR